MGIFSPLVTIYYVFVLKMKLNWYSRKKRKMKNVSKIFLKEKLSNNGFSEEITKIVIDNYLNFGETIFDREILEAAFSIDRRLFSGKSKTKKQI